MALVLLLTHIYITASYFKINGIMCCIVLKCTLSLIYQRREMEKNKEVPEHPKKSNLFRKLKSIAMNK